MAEPVVVRAAPSPTGDPHVGTAYIFLFNYALRQKRGGKFILRIDDTDRTRYQADAEQNIIDELAWLGLAFDEGPVRQSARSDRYREAVEELIAKGAAYRCDCTKERLDEVRARQRAEKEQPRYDGQCRDRDVSADGPHVVRLKVPRDGETTFADSLRGVITFANATIDDQVLLKTDGHPTYHLATVVDDHDMEVTHILRAEDWINSMPKHVLLYRAFGWEPPEHFHLPLLRNADKSKISKRKNHTSITWYRENGFLPEALLNFLGLMGWSMGEDREEFSLDEFIAAFEPADIKTSAPIFDLQKLEWLNGVYIRKCPPEDLGRRIAAVSELGRDADPALMTALAPLVSERMKRLTDFDDMCAFFFVGDDEIGARYEDLVPKKRTDTNTAAVLRAAREIVAELGGGDDETAAIMEPADLEQRLRALGAEVEWKPRELFMSIRYAITGKKVSPPIVECMCLLGAPACMARMDAAIDVLGNPENPILGQAGS